jgi:hypothetical protein
MSNRVHKLNRQKQISFPLALQPSFGPRPTSMKLSVKANLNAEMRNVLFLCSGIRVIIGFHYVFTERRPLLSRAPTRHNTARPQAVHGLASVQQYECVYVGAMLP